MPTITIRERAGSTAEVLHATLIIDHANEFPIEVTDPFSVEEEQRLEWYFEEHLRFPFTDQVKRDAAAASVKVYGENLFAQVFKDHQALIDYGQLRQNPGVSGLTFEIVGSPEFHRPHWEALKDPDLPLAFALEAPLIRKSAHIQPVRATLSPSPTINVLLVTARPGGRGDVGYRTISRPLVETLRQANLRVKIDLLRPATYQALVERLDAARATYGGPGYYHVIHFDVHGGLLTFEQFDQIEQQKQQVGDVYLQAPRYGRDRLAKYEGQQAFLFLEEVQEGAADPIEAGELAALLQSHQIPIAILNACQSAKQVGAAETSLGSRLMQGGAQLVLAMGYSVTVSAAEVLMRTLYTQLFAGRDVPDAIRRARLELHHHKQRRAYYNQHVELEDWLLPVVYQTGAQAVRVATRDLTPDEAAVWYGAQADRYVAPPPAYGFIGRDLDILRIERRLLRHNVLLIRGMGGAGKTTLLRHLAEWWTTTGLVERVFYFGYDERAWTRQQILHDLAGKVLDKTGFDRFLPLSLDAQQKLLAERLRAERHLLILDNLESVRGEALAIANTLPPAEREALRSLLADLVGGQTLVLLGSRGSEDWLLPSATPALRAGASVGNQQSAFSNQQSALLYDLGGLDPEAASQLADRILQRHNATQYRGSAEFAKLLKLLDGYPLALEVVLPNLVRQTPAEVLAALQAGEVALDDPAADDKTHSILRCIEYSHSNLEPAAQELLTCLAPFSTVINTERLPEYTEHLKAQPALAQLPFDRWPEVLQAAADWGLLTEHDEVEGYLRLQPIFPYFLRSRLTYPSTPSPQESAQDADAPRNTQQCEASLWDAIRDAFRLFYDGFGRAMHQAMQSKNPQERQTGQVLARLEYENLSTALDYALAAQTTILNPYVALSYYLDATQDQRRGLELGQSVLARLEQYPPEALAGQLGKEFVGVLDNIASRQLETQQYPLAEATYQKALALTSNLQGTDHQLQGKLQAGMYHQLGVLAQEQREWAQAEDYYKQALAIYVEFNARYEQAGTYHQLGVLAQEQRQWAQAEDYYQQALAIKIEFNDRYEQASTYHQLGIVAQTQREWAQAEGYYQQALAIDVEFNARYEQASTYHQLGIVAQTQRQWAQAEGYYKQALAIYVEFNNRYEQADTYHQLGRVAQEQRQWPQAEGYYQQALAIKIEFNARYEQASTYHQLGIVAQEQRQWAQAEGYYQQALAIKIEFNARYEQAMTYHQLGMVAQAQRQWAQAEDYYQQALAIFVEFNDRYTQAAVYHQLGAVAYDQNQWAQARDYFLQALTIALEYHDEYNVRQWVGNIGILWRDCDDAALKASLPAAVAGVLGVSAEEVVKGWEE